jgi:chromosome segregation ATPase
MRAVAACQRTHASDVDHGKIAAQRQEMSKVAQEWSDARLNDLAATLEPVPKQLAILTEAVEHLNDITHTLQPLPTQVAVLAASVERLTEENRTLRHELADVQHQLVQMAWGLVAAFVGAAAALISALH